MYIVLAVREVVRDVLKIGHPVYTARVHYTAAIDWLVRAQDETQDGGVSAWFSPLTGWRPSYVETTGYIIETFLRAADKLEQPELLSRAEQMGDFLLAQQLPSGAFRTHPPTQKKVSYPTVFDTGQDILGMCQLYIATGDAKYLDAAVHASTFLVSVQEKNGSWVKHTFGSRPHSYHTRVAWAVLQTGILSQNTLLLQSAQRFFCWAAHTQQANGWFSHTELIEKNQQHPYTHTIAYTIEGFLEAGILLRNKLLLKIAIRAALPPLKIFLQLGKLPATFAPDWSSPDQYMCLTGNAQFAVIWGELYKLTGDERFLQGLRRMNRLVSSTQVTSGAAPHVGAIKGSLPIYGDILRGTGYSRLAYLNWATKYFCDALLLEQQLDKTQ